MFRYVSRCFRRRPGYVPRPHSFSANEGMDVLVSVARRCLKVYPTGWLGQWDKLRSQTGLSLFSAYHKVNGTITL
jgi:hypothetical protein